VNRLRESVFTTHPNQKGQHKGGKGKHLDDRKASRQFVGWPVGLAQECIVDVICDRHKGNNEASEEEEKAAAAPKASLKSEHDRLRSSWRAAENTAIVPLKPNKTWKKKIQIERKTTDTLSSAETTWREQHNRTSPWGNPSEEGNDSSLRHHDAVLSPQSVPSQRKRRGAALLKDGRA